MTNILIVEDQAELREQLHLQLTGEGYEVYEAANGLEALELIGQVYIHLVIADGAAPGMDGFELTGQLRGAEMTLPILIISEKGTLEDKRKGFELGADDYMTRPVDVEELLLRVKALLRRCSMAEKTTLQAGNCILDSKELSVTWNSRPQYLRKKEFYLLYKLLSYPNKIFTRQNLMDEIWGYDTESDPRTVDTHIRRLRKKFSPECGFEIRTIRGLGYKAVLGR